MEEEIRFFEELTPVKKHAVLFFVVDTSESMFEDKISAVNSVMNEILLHIKYLSRESMECEVMIAVMQFSSRASWLYDHPIPVEDFQWNELQTGGVASFGDACKQLNEKLSKEKFMNSPIPPLAPLIVLFSDGHYSDDFSTHLAELKGNAWFKHGRKVAVAIGDDADIGTLSEFTGEIKAVGNIKEINSIMGKLRCIKLGTPIKRKKNGGDF